MIRNRRPTVNLQQVCQLKALTAQSWALMANRSLKIWIAKKKGVPRDSGDGCAQACRQSWPVERATSKPAARVEQDRQEMEVSCRCPREPLEGRATASA